MKTKHLIFFLIIFIAACSFKSEWYLLKSNELGFEILFPKQPKFIRKSVVLETGNQDQDIYYCDSTSIYDDNINYFAGRTEYSDTLMKLYDINPDLFFDSSSHNSAESVHGKVISEKIINYKNHPGREVKIEAKNGKVVITMRIYVVRNNVFILQTISYASKDNNSSQTKFFESFKLME